MQRIGLICGVLGLVAGGLAHADTVVANGTILGQTILGPNDVAVVEGTVAGALSDPSEAIGQEARVNLYAGRPIRAGDLVQPALVERNDLVTIRFEHGGLSVYTDGRALDRASAGQTLRVLNLSSRNTVTATVTDRGLVSVGPSR